VTLLYFADTRFPIERANGLQTMATCHALAERGHEVELVVRPDTATVTRDPFRFYGVSRGGRLTITTIPTLRSRQLSRLRFLTEAVVLARRRRRVVYTRDLGLASCLLHLPRFARPRLVYESHGIAPIVSAEMPRLLGGRRGPSRAKLRRLDRRERGVWQRATAYVAITDALARELASRYGARSAVFVVPDGARETAVAEPSDSSGTPLAAYAGHLYPWKGVDVFVQALSLAPAVHGLIVGGHPRESDRARVEQLARELGVIDRLEFTGLLPPSDVARQLERASILVLPNVASAISERYTSPLKLFEYLWLGRPIVASDLPALREVLVDEQSALLVPAGDAAALARAFERLVSDPSLARSLGAAARRLAPEFTWAKRASRLELALAVAREAS
jgi:glycosyltransferase involved in cell wall biosynthesis